jgi:predicted nucleic acid-binding protein
MISAPSLWLTSLHKAEWAHAIAQHVYRSQLSVSEAQQMHLRLHDDQAKGRWLTTGIPDRAFERCDELGRIRCPNLGQRTLDSLHVACALELKAEQFWTFDDRQAKVAKAEGLRVS